MDAQMGFGDFEILNFPAHLALKVAVPHRGSATQFSGKPVKGEELRMEPELIILPIAFYALIALLLVAGVKYADRIVAAMLGEEFIVGERDGMEHRCDEVAEEAANVAKAALTTKRI